MTHDIIIVGAGAAGLIAARELVQAGKSVAILEARDRPGGRIYPLPEAEFGYAAQGGAEFLHGEALISREILKAAGATFEHAGEWWSVAAGEPSNDETRTPHDHTLKAKLKALKRDMPVAAFFEAYLTGEEYAALRDDVFRRIEGYDAADPARFSAFALRQEVLDESSWGQMNVKQGYGLLVRFLEEQCTRGGAEIHYGKEVEAIDVGGASLRCADGSRYAASRLLVTVPLSMLAHIAFTPSLPEKLGAVKRIGFGTVIKTLLRFKSRWWVRTRGKDFERMSFMFSKEVIPTWWTQYPEKHAMLTGWLAGPKAQALSECSEAEILDRALLSLANIFKIGEDALRDELLVARVVIWAADPFARGAYSYPTPESDAAIETLLKPVDNKLFFAGEGLYRGEATGTVEAALASGRAAAAQILAEG